MQNPSPTVFIIMMENHNWSEIKQNSSAPYIHQTLLPMASHAEQYYNPPGVHPSEPNYLWLEAGTNFGVSPLLGDATNATNLSDLFQTYPWSLEISHDE